MSGLIRTEGLSKVYKDGTCAVKDLDLEVNQGELFAAVFLLNKVEKIS